MTGPRKLIEVALPLDAINIACKADKDRKTGTVRNLHKWFAPMPLPAWRALLFAALVDCPDDDDGRDRLLGLVERLVENGSDLPESAVLGEARAAIANCWPEGPPKVVDPFCGGGSTLIEAQRLGCVTIGGDLNPVPGLIARALTELLPKVAGAPSVSGASEALDGMADEYEGVVADVLHYASVVRERSLARLRQHYFERDGATTIAWLWCRTVKCPNPACGKTAPLIDSTVISRAAGDSEFHVLVDYPNDSVEPVFSVARGSDPAVRSSVSRSGATCLACHTPIHFPYIRETGHAGRLGVRAMAKVEVSAGHRRFSAVEKAEEEGALNVPAVEDMAHVAINPKGAGIRVPLYGISHFEDLFAPRQLLALSVFAEEVSRLGPELARDGASDDQRLAILAILGLCVGKLAQAQSSLVRWNVRNGATAKAEPAFARHDMAMSWDFAETNPFGASVGDWTQICRTAVRSIAFAPTGSGVVRQDDARSTLAKLDAPALIATDPPYYDQIGYADLSDYFYVWLRRAVSESFPDLFSTLATPKQDELIALPSRHKDSKDAARRFFVDGFTDVFTRVRDAQHDGVPALVVYAFKEKGAAIGDDIAPGWEAILEAMMAAGLMVVGTWPIHGTRSARMISVGTNALATYVVLVVRPRPSDAGRITRSDLARLLRNEMGPAVQALQKANIAPVDLAQAVIGPGMEIFSRHEAVVETDGSRVGVAQALSLINRTLGEILDEQEGDLDPDSRWAATWYEQHGFTTATFGEADRLARPKGIAVDALVAAGIVTSGANKVALIPRETLPDGWDPAADSRPTAWEAVHHLIKALLDQGGEAAAARLYARLGSLADPARELAYRLFQIADKAGRKDDALAYNGLVASWSEIARLAASLPDEPAGLTAPEGLF